MLLTFLENVLTLMFFVRYVQKRPLLLQEICLIKWNQSDPISNAEIKARRMMLVAVEF